MNRKKVIYNVIASFITQIISIVVALLVPRLLILIYGSEINGLVSSVNQIVRYFYEKFSVLTQQSVSKNRTPIGILMFLIALPKTAHRRP